MWLNMSITCCLSLICQGMNKAHISPVPVSIILKKAWLLTEEEIKSGKRKRIPQDFISNSIGYLHLKLLLITLDPLNMFTDCKCMHTLIHIYEEWKNQIWCRSTEKVRLWGRYGWLEIPLVWPAVDKGRGKAKIPRQFQNNSRKKKNIKI